MQQIDSENYALIHSIESLGTVDGPGLRFVLFFQGCALRCKYCHNRDTWDVFAGTTMSVDDIVSRVMRYKSFLVPSGGGVTASGGEPLLQAKFLANLFAKLKSKGISTALDTSGMFDINDDIKKVLEYTDLVLLDIKHIDPDKCKDLVGFTNKKELAFAKYLSDNNIPVWIRQVLVPGITNAEEDLFKLKDFIGTLNNVKKIEVLPYHDLGKYKWDAAGAKYQLEGVSPASIDDVKKAKEILGLE